MSPFAPVSYSPKKYDPFEHATEMGIEIIHRRLTTANGLWVPDHRVVFLQPRMHRVHERSVLAHELVHAEFGDVGREESQERRADRLAARRLIRRVDLHRATKISDDPGVWAMEIGVTEHLMSTYMQDSQWIA